jgi:hypothetical protein
MDSLARTQCALSAVYVMLDDDREEEDRGVDSYMSLKCVVLTSSAASYHVWEEVDSPPQRRGRNTIYPCVLAGRRNTNASDLSTVMVDGMSFVGWDTLRPYPVSTTLIMEAMIPLLLDPNAEYNVWLALARSHATQQHYPPKKWF